MSKTHPCGTYLISVSCQLKPLRCGYKTTLKCNSRSSGLTWAFHFLWKWACFVLQLVGGGRRKNIPEELLRPLHGSHIALITIYLLLSEAGCSTARTKCWPGQKGGPFHESFFIHRFFRSQILIWGAAAVAFLQKYYAFPILWCHMQDFPHTGFLFAWSRAGGPVPIFMAPFGHLHPCGGDIYNLGSFATHPGPSSPAHQWPRVGKSLMVPQEGQTWWCSVGCRYMTSSSFLF